MVQLNVDLTNPQQRRVLAYGTLSDDLFERLQNDGTGFTEETLPRENADLTTSRTSKVVQAIVETRRIS